MYFTNTPQATNGMYPGNGWYNANYIQPGAEPIKGRQPLTQEQIDMLRSETNKVDWHISETDVLKAKCTHREKSTGRSTLIDAGEDGKFKCTICGETFHLLETDLDDIQNHVNYMIDALQSIKAMYLDAPEGLSNNYFQIIPMLKNMTTLYKRACESTRQHDTSVQTSIMPGYFNQEMNSYQMMNNIMGYQPYGYSNPMPAPTYPGQPPVQMSGYGQQQMNPAGYGQQYYPNNYNPMTGGFMPPQTPNIPPVQKDNNAPAQQAQVQASTNNEEPVTQTKTFSV